MRAFRFTVLKRIAPPAGFACTTGWLTGLALCAAGASAQVIPDGTLPTNVTSGNNLDFAINGGARSGNNLFHSFSQFSVPLNGSAVFNNAADIQNIFSRVTGGTASNINGLIQASGSANLFLLNPSGILFGPNAKINIGGSFIGTTANSVKFADGMEFGATNPVPLLTISVPIGLQFGENPAAIQAQGYGNAPLLDNRAPVQISSSSGLQEHPGQTLALVGGEIILNGAEIHTGGGNVELGSVRSAAAVPMTPTSSGFTFSYSSVPTLGKIHLAERALIDVGSGSIQLQGQTIQLTEGALVIAQNFGSQPGGNIIVRATERMELSGQTSAGIGRSTIVSETYGTGTGSNLAIDTQQLALRDGAVIGTRTYSAAAGGSIEINASESVVAQGFRPSNPVEVSLIAAGTFADGKAGNVMVNTPQLSLRDGASLSSVNFGSGTGGDLLVNTQKAEIVGSSPTFSNSGLTSTNLGTGSAGTLTFNTKTLDITAGGAINTSSINDGRAGNITVYASDAINIAGKFDALTSTIASSVYPAPLVFQQLYGLPAEPKAQAGDVHITTPRLRITDGATLTVANLGLGNAGNLQVDADTLILDRGGKLEAATRNGEGGNIIIQSQVLQLRHLSQITTTAGGLGNGGNISIQSPIILGLENSDIIANAVRDRGGNIQITTQGIIGLQYRDHLTPASDITASSEFGINGTVQVNTIGADLNAGLLELPVDLIDPTQQIAAGCAGSQGSSFVVTGRGGIPENPSAQLNPQHPWTDTRKLTAGRALVAPAPVAAQALGDRTRDRLVEATGWRRNPNGQIELFAETGTTATSPGPMVTCAGGMGQR